MRLMQITIVVLLVVLAASCVHAKIVNAAFLNSTSSPGVQRALPFLPALFGSMLNRTVSGQIVYANSNVCISPFTTLPALNTTNGGIAGKFVLVGASCDYSTASAILESLGALAAIFPLADDRVPIPDASTPKRTIPILIIDPLVNALLEQDISKPNTTVTMTLLGTGPMVAAEKQAMASLYRNMTANGTRPWTFLGAQPWDLLLTAYAAYDPCLDRAYGVWCVDGHMVSMSLTKAGIVGPLSASIGAFTMLQHVSLNLNAISGALPCAIGSLTQLNFLSADTNRISDLSICFGQLAKLSILSLQNNLLTAVPAQLPTFTALTHLRLDNNFILALPDLSTLVKLQVLSVSNNRISSTIMSSFAFMSNASTIDLHRNNISGALVSTAFDGLASLTVLDLATNRISGPLPLLTGCTGLNRLVISSNQFTGAVPTSWSGLSGLTFVSLKDNQITSLPQVFNTLFQLDTVDVSTNNISFNAGSSDVGRWMQENFPAGIRSVNMAHNKLAGTFSNGFLNGFTSLQYLSLAGNLFTGPLPYDLWSMGATALASLDLSSNAWTGALPDGVPSSLYQTISFDNCPLLSSPVPGLPAFLAPSSEFILYASGTVSCPRLFSADKIANYKFIIDPTYYGYASCVCQRGFTSGGAPPNCVAFPTSVAVSAANGALTDGPTAGRLRQGADTFYTIQPNASAFTVINLQLSIFPAAPGTQFQLSLFRGASISAAPIFFFSSSSTGDNTKSLGNHSLSILAKSVTLHYVSDADGGPQFSLSYTTLPACASGFIADSSKTFCLPLPDASLNDVSASTKLAFLIVTSLLLALCAAAAVFLFVKRHDQAIQTSSLLISSVFLLGVCLVFASVLVATHDTASTQSCAAKVWLFNIGYVLAFGSLFVKTLRLYRIFNNTTLQTVIITEWNMLLQIAALVAVDVCVLAVWTATSPFEAQFVYDPDGDGDLDAHFGATCYSRNGFWFNIALIASKGVLLLLGSALNMLTKTLPVKFNETKNLSTATYTTTVAGIVWLGIAFGFGQQIPPPSMLVMQSLLKLFAATAALFSTVGWRLLEALRDTSSAQLRTGLPAAMESAISKRASVAGLSRSPHGASSSISSANSTLSSPPASHLEQLHADTLREWQSERDRMQKEFDAQYSKLCAAESQTERLKQKLEQLRTSLIDADMGIQGLVEQGPESMRHLEAAPLVGVGGGSGGGGAAIEIGNANDAHQLSWSNMAGGTANDAPVERERSETEGGLI